MCSYLDFIIHPVPQVANEIWLCDHKGVNVWKGDIRSYKRMLAKEMGINMLGK